MMKRLLALVLSLCFALSACAEAETTQHTEEGDGVMPETNIEQPVATGSYEKLALRLAALPELPEEPDESAFWAELDKLDYDKLGDKAYNAAYQALWEEHSAQQTAYYDALRALRGDGVDAALTPGLAAYTLRTARQLFENETEQNVVYSPANLYLALCMLAETTDGDSRAQILELLGLDSAEQARGVANALWRTLYRDGADGKTLLANSLWLNEQFDYHEDTVDTLANDYFASTFRAPMGDKATDAAIAEWINANTNGLLRDAAASLETKPETLMMLISTLYFKGTWSDQFDAYRTSEDVFTNAKGEEQRVDFMHQVKNGDYIRGNGFTIACLGFRDGSGVMYFLLPDEGAALDLDKLFSDLTQYIISDAELSSFGIESGYGEIHWSVPKFDISSDLDLIPQLEALGVTDIFEDGIADFSPLTDLDAVVSAVQHAARVKVDEEGCEAAAFTAIMAEATAMMPAELPVIEMNLNRPFGFLITGADGLPLFTGIVNTMQ